MTARNSEYGASRQVQACRRRPIACGVAVSRGVLYRCAPATAGAVFRHRSIRRFVGERHVIENAVTSIEVYSHA
ncbi:hypothetical protein [Solimonas marina]|uniref:hypothetical protein n=1 Tax=Solimonas marina TaxID=2714601 RepID=UPI00143B4937|nr:hypothetical protein [Solimonas marina]